MMNTGSNSTIKVLFFLTKIEPIETGGELHNRYLYNHMKRIGWDVEVFSENCVPEHFRRAPFCWLYYWRAIRALEKPSLILMSGGLEQRLVLPILLARILCNHRIAYISHLVFNYKKNRLLRWLYRLIYRITYVSTDTFLANSRLSASDLQRQHVPINRISVVYPGILINKSRRTRSFSGRMNDPQTVKILAVGFLEPRKGYHLLLEALKQVDLPFQLTIAGSTTVRPEYSAQLRVQVEQAGLSDKVEFAGNLSHERVLELMSEYDIFVQTSEAEGFGIAAFEAAAMGLAITGFLTPVFAEFFHNGKDSFFVSPGDIDGLKETFQTLISNKEFRMSLGDNAHALAITQRTWADVCSETEAVLSLQ
jgi:glycosyltransferase involved in cell wall biosynthesis